MRRKLLAGVIFLALAFGAEAGITFRTASNCLTTACTSASPMFCQTTPYTTTIYACDTASGFYVAVGTAFFTGQVVVPDCPSDLQTLRFGGFCKDTESGLIKFRDGAGVKSL